MDVAQYLEQVFIRIDEEWVVAFFEEVSSRVQSFLGCARVPSRDAQHLSYRVERPNLQQHVDMIGHPTVSVQPCTHPLDHLGSDLVEKTPVTGRERNIPSMIAAQGGA
jgi:hypothetical protein